MKFNNLVLTAILIVAGVFSAFAQTSEKFDFYTRGEYRPEVPRPQTILRYDVGDHHTTYAQMETVIGAIAKAAPDRVKIFDIGLTNEFRMQHVVAISSAENMARLDELKANNAKLTDPRVTNEAQANQIIQNNPAFVWLAYTIHGNESASFETMMQVIYQLAASNEAATRDILNNTVVLIVTGENPDGHERFVTWYNSVATGDAAPAALEHREPWSIYGRLSHFRFDLNRDNIAMSQRETQNMVKAFLDWNPQVSVDHHGQPSQFFFPPAALPINPNLPQPATNDWLAEFGRANAAAFDENRWDYYVRDIFDLFYPGYWDSFPSLNGAIGMTYETDGGGFKGLNWTRDDGTIVTLRSAIAKHFVASLTTLETVSKNRVQRLKDFYDFRRTAMRDAANEKLKRIVIVPDKDRVKAAELIEILQRGKIEVKVAGGDFSSNTAHNYLQADAPRSTQNFPAGSYVIDLNQPQKRWIKALLEQNTAQDADFVRDQLAKFRRNEQRGKSQNKEDYGFYDITAWNLPLAFGIDAFWTEDASDVGGNLVTNEYLAAQETGSVIGGRARIAYIIPYDTDAAAVLAMRLLQENFRVSAATKPLTAGGRNYKTGTFVVRVTRNSEKIHDAIARLARETGANVVAVNTGYTESGDTDVGSESVLPLNQPKIAVLADEGVEQTSFGSIWWTFDRYGIAFTALSMNSVKGGALKDYKILILPDASAGRLAAQFGEGGIASLKEWIGGGGTLITMRGSSVFAALKTVALTSAKLVGSDDDEKRDSRAVVEEDKDAPTDKNEKTVKQPAAQTAPTPELKFDKADGAPPELPAIASPSANRGRVPEAVPGAIMRATVDRTNYLTFGVNANYLPVLLDTAYFFTVSEEGANALVFDKNPPRAADDFRFCLGKQHRAAAQRHGLSD